MPATLDRTNPARYSERYEFSAGHGRLVLFRTAAVWATVIFLAVNLLLWKVAGEEKSHSKDLWSGTGSIDLAVRGFKALRQKPTVVLLGSSLVMFPFYAMDAETDPNLGDIFHHHGSAVLATGLKRAGFKSPSVYSLAIFGQMASDAFIYVDQYLQGDKKPDWLVLGIAPRDFSDHDLPTPTATFTFKRLVGFANFGRYAALYLPGWQDRAEFLFSHSCYFYSKRWRLQQEFSKATDKFYKMAGRAVHEPKAQVTDANAGFMLAGTAEQRWENSLKEYRRRYQGIGEKDLGIQMGFLDRLLEVCHERGINVVLVNMPLTAANRELMPEPFYARFRGQIASRSTAHGAHLLDLGDSSEFGLRDFWDSTHLNHIGGHKLVAHLITVLKP